MTIAEKLETLARLVGGRAWGLDQGKARIYMPSARDRQIYFEFPDMSGRATDQEDGIHGLGGASRRVFIGDCGQTANWYASQRAIALRSHCAAALAIAAWPFGAGKAAAIMELDELTAAQVDAAAGALANGRASEAWMALGLVGDGYEAG